MHSYDSPSLFSLTALAREKRRKPTPSEIILWEALRRRQLGVRFRRQHPLGGRYVVDFYCVAHKLVVEVDGAVHDSVEAAERDVARQAWLERMFGVRFVRVSAWLVEREIKVALDRIQGGLR